MGFGGKPKAPKPPPPPPKLPEPSDPDVEAARKRTLEAERLRQGRSSTVLTGGQGVEEQTRKKTLLGQ